MNSKQCLEIIFERLYLIFPENIREYLFKPIKQDLDKLKKLEKVIEILKEKIIDMSKILNSKNVEEYNNYVVCGFDFFDILPQEEYNLLKEVLGNETNSN